MVPYVLKKALLFVSNKVTEIQRHIKFLIFKVAVYVLILILKHIQRIITCIHTNIYYSNLSQKPIIIKVLQIYSQNWTKLQGWAKLMLRLFFSETNIIIGNCNLTYSIQFGCSRWKDFKIN